MDEFFVPLFLRFADVNPPPEFLQALRIANVCIGALACIAIAIGLARPRWRQWDTTQKLGWMSLFTLCGVGAFGTFELLFLGTYFRVPMVTVAMLWALLAALWPRFVKRGE